MNFGHRNYDVVIREPLFKKCFHPYTTLNRNIDCKWYIDGKCTYTEKDGCGYIYEELKKGVVK